MTDQAQDPGRPLTIAEVEHESGLTRPTIYRKMAAGTFPKPFKIDGTMNRWWECDIKAWKATLPRPSWTPGILPGTPANSDEKPACSQLTSGSVR